MSPLDVMQSVSSAWEQGNYDTLRTLLHPEGEWYLVDGEPRLIQDPDEFVAAIRTAQATTVYHVDPMTHQPLSDTVTLGWCNIRTPRISGGRHGHAYRPYFFLCEVRDALFFRSAAFDSDADARAAYDAGWQLLAAESRPPAP